MKILAKQTVLLTGASGGVGSVIAAAFAERGANLALLAFTSDPLGDVERAAQSRGAKTLAINADLRDGGERREVVERVRKELGPVDILVNCAGVEVTSVYHELTEAQIAHVLAVNLEAPMVLAKLVLPQMLERGKGHIVNISSIAGKAGPAFEEPYAATKAGLIEFTSSLRATYRGSGVSASVVVPVFVEEAGIYARFKARGCTGPFLLTGCSTEAVARAVIKAIEKDAPEVIVSRFPLRPALAVSALSPAFKEWLPARLGVREFFKSVIESEKGSENHRGTQGQREQRGETTKHTKDTKN